MSLLDRIGRCLFVALAVGLAWGIRGDYGHVVGAMYPGAILGLAFAYVSGQTALLRWMPIIAALAGLAISTGGKQSYGILHGYAQSDTLVNYAYGFFTLLLEGGAWGTFGGAVIGLVLERKKVAATEWVGLGLTIFAFGLATFHGVVTLLDFHINPPRSDLSIGFTGGAIGLFVWLALNRKPLGMRGALFGYIGFGLGMAIGRLLGNAVRHQPYFINHWNVMEVMCGFIGGFIFCWGMVGIRYSDPPENENVPLLSLFAMTYVLGLIPLLHRLLRIDEKRVDNWTRQLTEYKYQNPDGLSQVLLYSLDALCVAGFVGAVVWAWLHFRRNDRGPALPVLWLSAVMLLFQNTVALFFFYPRQPGINMHVVFWIMFALMVLYACLARPRPATEPGDDAQQVPWLTWTIGTLAAYCLIVFLAGYTNDKVTMTTAETRFPVWSWRQGLFPGR